MHAVVHQTLTSKLENSSMTLHGPCVQVLGFDPASQDAIDENILAALRDSGIDVDKLNFEDI